MKKLFSLVMMICIAFALLNADVLTLDEAKELLLQRNTDYLAKEYALNSARWDMRQAFAALFPAARLQGGYNYLDPKPFVAAQENYSLSYGLSVNQPLFMGGKLWLAYRMKRDAAAIAEADLDNTRLKLLAELEEAYYNCLLTSELYTITQNALKIAANNLEIAQTRLDTGTISGADFLQLKSELSSREVALLQAENNSYLSYRRLQNMLKIEDFTLTDIDFTRLQELMAFFQKLDAGDREQARASLTAYGNIHNPLLKMVRTGKEISRKSLNLAKGNFLPTVNLTATKSWNDNFTGGSDFKESTTYILSASIPIFPIFDNYAGYRKGYHSFRKTEMESLSAEDNIKMAIEASLFAVITSSKSINSSSLALEYAEETYKMMEERFRNGMISSFDLIGIELLLTTARLSATRSKYDFLKNRSSLMNLLNIEDAEQLLKLLQQ